MSYLSILLLTLLAAHAKAQEDEAESTVPSFTTEVTEAAPEDDGVVDGDAQTEQTTETPLVEDEPETTTPILDGEDSSEADAGTEAPAEGNAEAVTPTAEIVDDNEEDSTTVNPAVEDETTEANTEADQGEDVGAETTTVAPGDPETEPPATTEAANPDVNDPVEPEATTETPSQEPGSDEQSTAAGAVTTTQSEVTPTDDSEDKAPATTIEEEIIPQQVIPGSRSGFLGAQPEENTNKQEEDPKTSESGDPEGKGSSGALPGILFAITVAAVSAVTGYFAYQKKKLCFKNRQPDPEAARKADPAEAQSDPQTQNPLLPTPNNQQ